MKRISRLLKNSYILYGIYYYVFSTLLKFCGIFVRTDEKLILFNSYGGKKYDDSPREIFEVMRKEKRFEGYTLIWALHEPEKHCLPSYVKVIKSDTIKYFYICLKAKVWITNSSIERGLNFKKKSTICLNTWHGTAIKKMGIDIGKDNQSFRSKNNIRADIMLAQSQYDVQVFSHAFNLPVEVFRIVGLPRNDMLANYSKKQSDTLKKQLGISMEKKILLYAPTFREYTKGNNMEVILNVPIDLQYWQKVLGKEYIVLFRAHYEVAKHMQLKESSIFIDVSTYPDLNELMVISDGLISDYSSIYFDYSIMGKPMYCFAYDFDIYMKKRGMYLDLRKELPCDICYNEKTLLQTILKGSSEEKYKELLHFREKFVSEFGNAALKSCDVIYEKLNKEK